MGFEATQRIFQSRMEKAALNGWKFNKKEKLFLHRVFRRHYKASNHQPGGNLDWRPEWAKQKYPVPEEV